MNDNIKLVLISGDGNLRDGHTVISLTNKNNSNDDFKCQMIEINSQEDYDKVEAFIIEDSSEDLYHIDHLKEYLNRYKKGIFPKAYLDKFHSSNEFLLFSNLSDLGNISFINSDYVTILYLPKYINDKLIQTLEEMDRFSDNDKMIRVVESSSGNSRFKQYYPNYSDFLANLKTKGPKNFS